MRDNLQKTFLLVLIQIFLILLIVLYFILKRSYAPNYIFLILISMYIFYVSYVIIFYRRDYLIFLIIFAISIGIIPIIYLNEIYYLEKDAIFESQFSDSIIKYNRFDPSLGKGFAENYYGYNPLLHIIIARLSILSGLSVYEVSKFLLPLIFRVLILILIYILTLEITNDKFIASVSSLISLVSPAFIPISVSRRTLGEVFLLLNLLFLIKYNTKNKLFYYILFLISSVLIIISDHSTSYMFLLLLISAYLFSLITNTFIKNKVVLFSNISVTIILFAVLFFTWETIFAPILFRTDIGYISDVILFIRTNFGLNSIFGVDVYGPPAVHINLRYETILAYFGQLVFLGIAFFGMIYLFINYKRFLENYKKRILFFLVVFGFVGYVLSGLLIRTRLNVFSSTILWIFTIPLSIIIAISLVRLMQLSTTIKKLGAGVIIALIFISGLIIGFTPSITNRDFNKDIVLGEPRSRSLELFESGQWLKSRVNEAKIVGDPTVFDIYSGFFSFDTSTDFETSRVYKSNPKELDFIIGNGVLFGNYKHTQVRSRVNYFIVNKNVLKYPSFIFNKPLKEDNLNKFDNSKLLNKVYDNNKIYIYDSTLN